MRKRKIADDFIGQSFSDLTRCCLQHRSITLNLQGKISASTRRFGKDEANNKRQDVTHRTTLSVLSSASTLPTIVATTGRCALRRPTTEDLGIQKRKVQVQQKPTTPTDERCFPNPMATTDDYGQPSIQR